MFFAYPFINYFMKFLWFFKPTDGRFIHLRFAYEGLQRTGIAWVEYDGAHCIPFCAGDDLGIYWIIPHIASFLNCSLDRAIMIFFYGVPLAAYSIGLVGFFLLYPAVAQKIVSVCVLTLLLAITLYIGDVYILYSASAMALIPLTLYLCLNKANYYSYGAFGTFTGIVITVFHFCRSFSSMPAFLFIFVLCVCTSNDWWRKIIMTTFLLSTLAFIVFFINAQKSKYHTFIQQEYPTMTLEKYQHGLWHTIYCGLGFFKFMNKHQIEWNDACAQRCIEKRRAAGAENLSDEYILKEEVGKLLKEELHFVVFSLFGKLGILLLLLLMSGGIGIVAGFLFGNLMSINCAFFVALVSSAVFPLLAMPFLTYALGFISCGLLYTLVTINCALNRLLARNSATTHCA